MEVLATNAQTLREALSANSKPRGRGQFQLDRSICWVTTFDARHVARDSKSPAATHALDGLSFISPSRARAQEDVEDLGSLSPHFGPAVELMFIRHRQSRMRGVMLGRSVDSVATLGLACLGLPTTHSLRCGLHYVAPSELGDRNCGATDWRVPVKEDSAR
jgi:hypothetical protein